MIAVAFALEFESAFFRAKHDPRLRLAIWLLGAMGSGAAVVLEKKLAEVRPELVISAGFAGGLQTEIGVGDLVLGRNYSDARIVERLVLSDRWHIGDVHTCERILETVADKRRLGTETGGLAADLETRHMADVCRRRGVPMLSVRCISDAVEDPMPVPAETLLNPVTGRPEPLQLFKHLVTNPGSVPGFNRLLKNAKIAQAHLASGLDEILPQLLRGNTFGS